MKLYNTIIVWDIYVVAENEEAAREAARLHIKEGLRASEETAIETRDSKNIRSAWLDERPLVGADVSDADFEKLKGKTTTDVFAMLHQKAKK